MKIISLKEVGSTHEYLKNYIKKEGYTELICCVTKYQTDGIGSRGNSWSGRKGNLFFSFAIKKEELPKDLPLQSASIYFSYLLKKQLEKLGSKVWLKWPNDFYINELKVGGTITTATGNLLLCGIGLNLLEVSEEFGFLDISIDENELLNDYLINIKKELSWQDVLNEYVIEFKRSEKFHVTVNNHKVSLKDAQLNDDGSIQINGEKVFSLR